MKMFKILPFLLIGLMSSCMDDELVNTEKENAAQVGDEIVFGTMLPTEAETRTIYGDLTDDGMGGRYYPVYWENDKDSIVIFCPQASAPAGRSVEYKIQAEPEQSVAKAVVKIGDTGLQWGTADVHNFYAVYPSSAVLDNQTSQGTSKTNIANVQRYVEVKKKGNTYVAYPDMHNAVMMAYNTATKTDKVVNLSFKPQMTVLDVVVNGPESGSPIELSSLLVQEANHKPICGDYVFKMDEAGNVQWMSASQGVVNSQVVIPCKGIKLAAGEKAVFKVFIAPDLNSLTDCSLKFTVNTLNGSKTKTLKQDATHKLVANKVNRVILPNLVAGTNYWMSNLDPDIYITELSYPGSKMAFITRYQNAPLKEQFEEGVRAFIIQTNVRNGELVVASEYQSVTDPQTGKFVPVTEVMQRITACIDKAKADKAMQEFVFVMFTYIEAGSENATVQVKNPKYPGWWEPEYKNMQISQKQNWMRVLRETCKAMATANPIYTPEVTADTKISDVAGKIVLKANYNGDDMYVNYKGSDMDAPLMFSDWIGAYPQTGINQDGVPLIWGRMKNAPKMKWFYQEVTVTSNDGSTEITYAKKLEYVNKVFDRSVQLYSSPTNKHEIWFANDLGGSYAPAELGLSKEQTLSKKIHPEATKKLQNRSANASLGLIFMNFADRRPNSGQKYGSDWLIQTVIDNNFKFPLRKATSAPASAPTRVTVESGSDGWDE